MGTAAESNPKVSGGESRPPAAAAASPTLSEAEATLNQLASVVNSFSIFPGLSSAGFSDDAPVTADSDEPRLSPEARYRALVEQIPAVIFMAYLDRGVGEAYVSPQIEAALGFSQREWLEDPVRWYERIHPDDKARWSVEAAQMFVTGKPLRSAYRVIARDGRVVWFRCGVQIVGRQDGRPWFIHGAAFEITDLKRAEESLRGERNLAAAILDTVGALVVVLDHEGRIVRFNRACEQTTGYSSSEVMGNYVWNLFMLPEEREAFRKQFGRMLDGLPGSDYEGLWVNRRGERRLIGWSTTVLRDTGESVTHVIATGIDLTERKRLESKLLDVSAREQRRIGQDLHDGLGQHLTGIAFLSKVLEEKLAERALSEEADAAKIVHLVNEAIQQTRELARGLLPVISEAQGLMSALGQWASKVEDVFGISCRFECDDAVLIHDETQAAHLYHIAQEATNNAIKHGKPARIVISLHARERAGMLSVKDDGLGFPEASENHAGMGLHIMRYRAKAVGGTLDVQRGGERGTVVICVFPIRNAAAGETS